MTVLGTKDHDHLAADLALGSALERVIAGWRERGRVDIGRKVADGGFAPWVECGL